MKQDGEDKTMGMKQTYAVFGLGRYGRAVAKELVNSGAEVLAVDCDEEIINAAAAEIPFCKRADITDAEVIKQLGIANVDVVIIAMASCLEASVMATMLCKEAGVKTVIAKCSNEMHRKVLGKVGADKVVFPENDSGIRLAKNLLSSGFVDIIELSEDVSMVELDLKPEWEGKTLLELNLRKKYAINVVAIRQAGEVCTNIDPEKKLEKSMKLIVIADSEKWKRLT
ncbi:MAG: TrkA family potassium uptake protein [Roseburia sp.]|nr:TrkA family potassium uptake protein [Ruminococcus sp.]MCM1155839.1 TrkA family potassium uptake protein [Roseburia sp.]MCM1243785.1 TrkA family potassium uptake protein [Roseburia sp.]